jgi:uncharacterized protein
MLVWSDAKHAQEWLFWAGLVAAAHRRGSFRGWKQKAYLHKDAPAGRKMEGSALLSPFDPLIWYRPRTERLFGFRYRLETYTPAHRREHGYCVLPFLLDGALVARVDLKADRKAATLLIQRAYVEPGAARCTLERLIDEPPQMALWLGLSRLGRCTRCCGRPHPCNHRRRRPTD